MCVAIEQVKVTKRELRGQRQPVEITISPDEINDNQTAFLVISSEKIVISGNPGCQGYSAALHLIIK